MSEKSLIGTWRVLSFTRWSKEGVAGQPLGAEPVGYAVFDATGHAFVQVGRSPNDGGFPDEDRIGVLRRKIAQSCERLLRLPGGLIRIAKEIRDVIGQIAGARLGLLQRIDCRRSIMIKDMCVPQS